MPRNFDRRVEVMFPIEAEDIRWRIVDEIIPVYLATTAARDCSGRWQLRPRGAARRHTAVRSRTQPARTRDVAAEADSRRVELDHYHRSSASVFEAGAESNGAPAAEKKTKKEKDKKGSTATT